MKSSKSIWILGSVVFFLAEIAVANEYIRQKMDCKVFAREESIIKRRQKLPLEDFFTVNLVYVDYSEEVKNYPVVSNSPKYKVNQKDLKLRRALVTKLSSPRVSVVSFNQSRQGNLYTFADSTLTSGETTNLLHHFGAKSLDYEDEIPGVVLQMSGIENIWLERCVQTHLPPDRKNGLSFHICSHCKVTKEPEEPQD